MTSTEPVSQATPGAPNLKVRGELTVKSVTLPVDFLATAGITPEGKAAAQAFLTIDRTLWNVIYGSGKFFRNLGGHLVNDLIEFQLRIVTR
jgi:polyisoprenoid-binding protein YceI